MVDFSLFRTLVPLVVNEHLDKVELTNDSIIERFLPLQGYFLFLFKTEKLSLLSFPLNSCNLPILKSK